MVLSFSMKITFAGVSLVVLSMNTVTALLLLPIFLMVGTLAMPSYTL